MADMIRSMTGYGKAVKELPGSRIRVEVKSLNSKGLDLNMKVPSWFRERELEIRKILSSLQRGKIDLFISMEDIVGPPGYMLNKSLAKQYHELLRELQQEFGEESSEGLLPLVMRMPDLLQSRTEEMDQRQWEMIHNALDEALEELEQFRVAEGTILKTDLEHRIMSILSLLDTIDPFEAERKETVRKTLQKSLESFAAGNGDARPDANRFEEELVYYLEKMDFTEEKVRLRKHCDFFLEILTEEESQGKKLGFICQEIGREINTLGSKAYHAGIQKIVVGMKDELEKIKEQLLNIL